MQVHAVFFFELVGQKVDDLEVRVLLLCFEQEILWLEVSMDDFIFVAIANG